MALAQFGDARAVDIEASRGERPGERDRKRQADIA